MDSNVFLRSVRKRLAFLLAKASCEVFPDAQVVAIEGTDNVFFADICFSQPFVDAFIPLIEERLRDFVKNQAVVSKTEMVPLSARGLLERAGQKLQILKLPSHSQVLVHLSFIDEFALLTSAEEEEETDDSQRFFWDIISAAEIGETGGQVEGLPIVRIMGIACADLATLKINKKSWAKSPYVSPSELVHQAGYLTFYDTSWIWLPDGEKLRQELQSFLKIRLIKEGFHMVSTGGNTPLELGLKEILEFMYSNNKGELRLAEAAYAPEENEDFQREGVLTPFKGWTDRFVRICPKERLRGACISSLQFILQIPRMLSFDTQVVLCSSLSEDTKDLRAALDAVGVDYRWEKQTDRQHTCVEVRLCDRLGRWWPGPSLWISKERLLPNQRAVFASCLGKWERLVGLLVEKLGNGKESKLEQFIQKLKQE